MPTDEIRTNTARRNVLKRIADILDVPAGTLYAPQDAQAATPAAALREDARAMLAAFLTIRDPERRRDCLAYVRAIGTAEAAASPDGGAEAGGA